MKTRDFSIKRQPSPPEPEPWSEWTLEAMELYGGGFVKALRRAYLCADTENRRRILMTWPGYGQQYREMGEELRRRVKAAAEGEGAPR